MMEYIDGDDIKKRIDERKVLPVDEALAVILQIAHALDHMHGRGIIHRDIKPANIMMTRGNVAKLADLGLARDLRDPEDMKLAKAEAGKAYGTPWYISPEQIRGREDVAGPADIYCLGATLYHMVTGKVPFDGANQSEVFNAHLSGKLVPPDQRNPQIDEDTALIIETMLQRDLLKRARADRGPRDLPREPEAARGRRARAAAAREARCRPHDDLDEHLLRRPRQRRRRRRAARPEGSAGTLLESDRRHADRCARAEHRAQCRARREGRALTRGAILA
jgi:serine/threonine-protein kinase